MFLQGQDFAFSVKIFGSVYAELSWREYLEDHIA